MQWIRPRRPSPALVISLIALFIALGGTGYAALKLPKNSVGTKQLKKNAVVSSKVKNHSLLAADFKAGQLPAGPQGPQGPQGPKGDKGDTGPATGPAGGDLTGNYPNPTIATDAVNGAKVANRSLNADDVTQDSGQKTYDFGSLAAGTCDYALVQTGVSDLTGYLLFASPGNAGGWPGNVIVNPYLSNLAGYLRIRACNISTGAIDPPSTTFNWAVMKVA